MKKGFAIIMMLLLSKGVFCCPACRKLQPKVWQSASHGIGPQYGWEYILVVMMSMITIYVLYTTARKMFKPGEIAPDHIKRTILNY